MGAFLKTFVVCLILALGYLAYNYLGKDSFSPSLKLSDSNPVFSVNKTSGENSIQEEDNNIAQTSEDVSKPEENKNLDKKYAHTCYFYGPGGKMIPVKREIDTALNLENTITLLLKGPLISETKKGIYSEIPPDVSLINVQRKNNKIIVNLTANFGNGGGSESIENRVKQLAKTVKSIAPGKDIYLYINGSEVEYLGGEGVFVKQPLE